MAKYFKLDSGQTIQIRKDLSGRRFGMLTALEPCEKTENGSVWKCLCDCGKVISRTSSNLLNAKTKYPKSCGCYIESMKTHNKGTRLHSIWSNMKQRCNNSNSPVFYRYGGRGIKVCDEWDRCFDSFKKWATGNGYSDSLTLDRINNDKGYSPDNCRWVDMRTQCNNTGRNHYITWNGESHTMTEWSRILGINYGTLKSRVYKYKKSDIEALEMGVDGRK